MAATMTSRTEVLNDVVRATIKVAPDLLNEADWKGQTPLMLASSVGAETLVEILLAAPGVDLDAQDYLGRTALHAAIGSGNQSVVRLLASRSTDPFKATAGEGNTVLHTAARFADPDIAKIVVDAFPNLMEHPNDLGLLPAELCEEMLLDYPSYVQMMRDGGRREAGLESIQATLKQLVG